METLAGGGYELLFLTLPTYPATHTLSNTHYRQIHTHYRQIHTHTTGKHVELISHLFHLIKKRQIHR